MTGCVVCILLTMNIPSFAGLPLNVRLCYRHRWAEPELIRLGRTVEIGPRLARRYLTQEGSSSPEPGPSPVPGDT